MKIGFHASSAKFSTTAENKTNLLCVMKIFRRFKTSETSGEGAKNKTGRSTANSDLRRLFHLHKDLRGESQKAPVVLVGVRYAWTTKDN